MNNSLTYQIYREYIFYTDKYLNEFFNSSIHIQRLVKKNIFPKDHDGKKENEKILNKKSSWALWASFKNEKVSNSKFALKQRFIGFWTENRKLPNQLCI